jgi:aminoglycoside phosphotransferase (APT) family kinase protein
MRMHEHEVEVDAGAVRRLLAAQRPVWADRPLAPVPSSGTDNALFRLGEDLVVRLPRIDWAVEAVEREHRWLPVLAPHVPLAVPEPVFLGGPGEGYPWPWAVYRWIDGADAFGPVPDPVGVARDLAGFLTALQGIDPTGAPVARRGRPLASVDEPTRRAIAEIGDRDLGDAAALAAAWDHALAAPAFAGPPVWVHGDVARGNLLVREGRLAAVIDFGGCGVGDPACDLVVAWDLFEPPARGVLRAAVGGDEATWDRGRGWALTSAALALPYYLRTNPPMVAQARHKLAAVLADLA